MVFCRVLGAIEIEVDGAVVDLGGPIPRRLLAALTAGMGEPISDTLLAEIVWDAELTDVLTKTIRVAVHRLRTALGPSARHHLDRAPSGYRLTVPSDRTDHGCFVDLVSDGVRALSDWEADRATKSLESALALWRGQPWTELAESLTVSAPRARLQELREVAVEELQAARLMCGDAARAVAALSEAVIEAPYRERRWELMALGLYRTGRQGHALAELRRVRQLLVDELGVEPGSALRTLEQRMLDHDPGLLLVESPAQSDNPPDRPAAPSSKFAVPTSSLIGRRSDLALLDELLGPQRLVTIVGPAGVGKTRLALEYGAGRTDAWLARLADVHSADAIASVVASAIGLTYVAWDATSAIWRAIADRPGLLVLDNCEHLVDDVAEFLVPLLSQCRELRVVATSRRALNVEGEYTMALAPLAVVPAVELLFDRVGVNRVEWRPQDEDRVSARVICEALDGLPLAIELAAARERVFGLSEIAAHIHRRLDILGSTPRGSLSPHASLEAAIGWSVDQLGDADRALLLRLWPFEGGLTWQAAQAVQPAGVQAGVLAVLASLADRSMIEADVSSGRPRYRMLETVRRYCEEVDPSVAASREAHAAWVRGFAADEASLLFGPRSGQAIRELQADLANIRAGIAHDLEHCPIEALRTTAQLGVMWITTGTMPEGMRLLQNAMAACPEASVTDRAEGMIALSLASLHAGDAADALRLADDVLDLLDETDPAHEIPFLRALSRKCNALADLNDPIAFRAATNRYKVEADRRAAPDYIRASALIGVGGVQLLDGESERAMDTLTTGRMLSEQCGYWWGRGIADLLLAWGLLARTELDRSVTRQALDALTRAVDAYDQQPNISSGLGALYAGAFALTDLGSQTAAIELGAAVIEYADRIGTDPRRYGRRFNAGDRMDRLDQMLPEPGDSGESKSWPMLVEMFSNAVAQLPSR